MSGRAGRSSRVAPKLKAVLGEVYSPEQVAEMFDVRPRQVHQWITVGVRHGRRWIKLGCYHAPRGRLVGADHIREFMQREACEGQWPAKPRARREPVPRRVRRRDPAALGSLAVVDPTLDGGLDGVPEIGRDGG